jgi:anti-sigma regulatory factor (Ser/Thr protein kinase)
MFDGHTDTTADPPRTPMPTQSFHHEALLYAGEGGFVAGTVPFIREAVAAGEPILVVVGAGKIARLREVLGADAERVRFADMALVGENPARIIPAWEEFVREHAGRPVRGIGEPIGPDRRAAELVECHRHESLLNVAFADTPAFTLLCPYDTEGLDPSVIAEAHRTHPYVRAGDEAWQSSGYGGVQAAAAPFAAALPEPTRRAAELAFDLGALSALRTFVATVARAAGMAPSRIEDLILAVSEIAANSIRHGGGHGVLRVWDDDAAMVCEVRDDGRFADALAGRRRPEEGQQGGYGLWIANQLCELVQVRTFAAGSVVRLHMRLA